jgi:hypothetical protein
VPASDILEAIRDGRTDRALPLERLERPLPASWNEQGALDSDAGHT